jgi:hypothetical protein
VSANCYDDFISELKNSTDGDAPVVHDVEVALRSQPEVRAYFVRPQTLFDTDSVYESVSCYAVTDAYLLVVSSDISYEFAPEGELLTSVRTLPLRMIEDFQLLRRRSLQGPHAGELSAIGIHASWGGTWLVDTLPAGCDDPSCTLDHGTMSHAVSEDLDVFVDTSLDAKVFSKGADFILRLHEILIEANR